MPGIQVRERHETGRKHAARSVRLVCSEARGTGNGQRGILLHGRTFTALAVKPGCFFTACRNTARSPSLLAQLRYMQICVWVVILSLCIAERRAVQLQNHWPACKGIAYLRVWVLSELIKD